MKDQLGERFWLCVVARWYVFGSSSVVDRTHLCGYGFCNPPWARAHSENIQDIVGRCRYMNKNTVAKESDSAAKPPAFLPVKAIAYEG
jgi:hypothetical protein